MKYLARDVLIGSRLMDEEKRNAAKLELEQAQQEKKKLVQKAAEDMPVLRRNLEDLLAKMAMPNTVLTTTEVTNAGTSNVLSKSYNRRSLGLETFELNKIDSDIKRKHAKYQSLVGSSDLTKFLETVTEEYITDYGLKSAGFSGVSAGRLVVKAVNARG